MWTVLKLFFEVSLFILMCIMINKDNALLRQNNKMNMKLVLQIGLFIFPKVKESQINDYAV
jgi:hypothetical protein